MPCFWWPPCAEQPTRHCQPPAAPPPPPTAGPPIHHFDLYRLTAQYDLARLDLAASFAAAVCLVEWPERLGAAPAAPQPAEPLHVAISILAPGEQAALQAALPQRHVEPGGSGGDAACSDSGEDEEGSGGDARWRRIELATAAAGERWAPRLQLLRRYLAAEGAAVGCFLEERSGSASSSGSGAPP